MDQHNPRLRAARVLVGILAPVVIYIGAYDIIDRHNWTLQSDIRFVSGIVLIALGLAILGGLYRVVVILPRRK